VGAPAGVTLPRYEGEVARDLARRAALVAPGVVLVAGLLRGVDGAVSAAIGLILVAVNFLVSARMITGAARRSPSAVMGVVLGGYVVRLAVLLGIVLALQHAPGIDIPTLVVTIAATHLALLTWELRFVSLTLGAPGLKPAKR
jgi:hypothetical protein